jgi:hypothetical protein
MSSGAEGLEDYDKAFAIAWEQLTVPDLTRRETRSVARAKEQVAKGKSADAVSTQKTVLTHTLDRKRSSMSTPVSSPGKAMARGHPVGSPGKQKARGPHRWKWIKLSCFHCNRPFLLLTLGGSARHPIPRGKVPKKARYPSSSSSDSL